MALIGLRTLRRAGLALLPACGLLLGAGMPDPPVRIEARSAHLLAVGIVRDDRLQIHISRLLDNAPVRDAVVTVLLRGTVHPTTAEADGGYGMETQDLRLPGSAALVFRVVQGEVHEDLEAALEVAKPAADAGNSTRQLGWWVLNFAVCIAFLMLMSRRRKAAGTPDTEDS